ncbi:DICT sensory domain-containing protein [Alkalinema pantanalense CENA528]|uniref:DICT sensory domain-containing protein n=1 Tax=Alkalinema pantanalense TaxID=1620705 RepID=UPI003D6F0272
MIIPNSVLDDLFAALPQVRPQMYFKSSLTALSHAMEDQVLAGSDKPLVIASFQRERFYKQEAHRYARIAERTNQVYVLAAPETDFANRSIDYEMVAFDPSDPLSQEWHLVVLGRQYACCLICKEKFLTDPKVRQFELHVDQSRRFEGIWSFDREIVCKAAELLLQRIMAYRPELATKVGKALGKLTKETAKGFKPPVSDPFAERLVTYLQVGQYKLSKAYRAIAEKERKERLVNLMTTAIRRSLDPAQVLQVATQELGQVLQPDRCLIYRCKATDVVVRLEHEFLDPGSTDAETVDDSSIPSLRGMAWDLAMNPVFEQVVQVQESLYIEDTECHPLLEATSNAASPLQYLLQTGKIRSWLMVPVLYQDRLLGIVELHYCDAHLLQKHELELVDAIAAQIGIALIQAEAFANLEDLNQQLEALERTRSNLIAITGHELRTPLSTIQVCLESLSTDPTMPAELRQVMLSSALSDAERMRKLIQDFLTLSRLESGRVEWRMEPQPLQECVDLALSSLKTRYGSNLPQITVELPDELPMVRVDGEWLVEVLSKLLDNACKFTDANGEIHVQAKNGSDRQMLEVIVADTGRGIEPNRLERVFERFYQEEGALRRSTGGTGLGLAICRQIIAGWGGKIWAESAGKDRGSQFHFTMPIARVS